MLESDLPVNFDNRDFNIEFLHKFFVLSNINGAELEVRFFSCMLNYIQSHVAQVTSFFRIKFNGVINISYRAIANFSITSTHWPVKEDFTLNL